METPTIGQFHKRITAVGSRVTCNPPPTDTDQDWLVLVDDKDFDKFAKDLIAQGWQVGGSLISNDANYLPPNQRFNSFTLGVDNVIATASQEFHDRFLSASATAKHLNLLNKEDRIALFQSVLYAAVCDPAFKPQSAPVNDPFTEFA